jgi:hypothetical protein
MLDCATSGVCNWFVVVDTTGGEIGGGGRAVRVLRWFIRLGLIIRKILHSAEEFHRNPFTIPDRKLQLPSQCAYIISYIYGRVPLMSTAWHRGAESKSRENQVTQKDSPKKIPVEGDVIECSSNFQKVLYRTSLELLFDRPPVT